jgi:MFS transporter, ACDE family, multidrug resistance protein
MQKKEIWALQIIFSISITAVMGLTTVSPAFPKIALALCVSKEQIGLLLSVFALPGIILTPILGVLADRFGRKTVLIPSLFIFAVAGVSCAFARSFGLLLVLRFFEGIGAASLGALNVTLIGDIFSGNKRITTMGYNASVLSIGTAIFPLIGGALANIQWYYPFFLPSFALLVGLVTLLFLNNPEPKRNTTLKDYFSSIGSILKEKKVIAIFMASFTSYIVLFGSFLTYIPFFVINLMPEAKPLIIGIVLSSMSITTAIVTLFMKYISQKVKLVNLMKIAFILYAIAFMIIPFINNFNLIFLPTIIYGIAQGFFLPASLTLLTEWTRDSNRAGLMSFNRMISQVGQALGPLLMGLFFVLSGLSFVFFAGAIISILLFLFICNALRGQG